MVGLILVPYSILSIERDITLGVISRFMVISTSLARKTSSPATQLPSHDFRCLIRVLISITILTKAVIAHLSASEKAGQDDVE